MAVRYHVVDLLRATVIREPVAVKGVSRSRWRKDSGLKGWDPRPTLVEFPNSRHRNRSLAEAITRGGNTTKADDVVISGIESKNTKGESLEFIIMWLQGTKWKSARYVRGITGVHSVQWGWRET